MMPVLLLLLQVTSFNWRYRDLLLLLLMWTAREGCKRISHRRHDKLATIFNNGGQKKSLSFLIDHYSVLYSIMLMYDPPSFW